MYIPILPPLFSPLFVLFLVWLLFFVVVCLQVCYVLHNIVERYLAPFFSFFFFFFSFFYFLCLDLSNLFKHILLGELFTKCSGVVPLVWTHEKLVEVHHLFPPFPPSPLSHHLLPLLQAIKAKIKSEGPLKTVMEETVAFSSFFPLFLFQVDERDGGERGWEWLAGMLNIPEIGEYELVVPLIEGFLFVDIPLSLLFSFS